MALKLAKVAGEKKKVAAPPDTDLGIPTTQVKMGTTPSPRRDPLSTRWPKSHGATVPPIRVPTAKNSAMTIPRSSTGKISLTVR